MVLLSEIRPWAPFKIDALGIITLLGADPLRQILGRLVDNGVVEYLPLLAAQVIADDTIAQPVPGFVLYNITDKIKALDLSAWFTRWLLCQDLKYCSSTITLRATKPSSARSIRRLLNFAISVPVNAFPIIFASIIGDWYGLACAVSILVTTAARALRFDLLRRTLDNQVLEGSNRTSDSVKVLITLPNGKCVTVATSRGIVLDCILTEVRPKNENFHLTLRGLVWVAFSISIVTLGMACLAMQLVVTLWLIIPSLMALGRVGSNESVVSDRLYIHRNDTPGIDTRAKCYAQLSLTKVEEEAMVDWHLFPLRSNTMWWARYLTCQNEFRTNNRAFEDWPNRMAQPVITQGKP